VPLFVAFRGGTRAFRCRSVSGVATWEDELEELIVEAWLVQTPKRVAAACLAGL
jgi:hypothetical protein